MSYLLKSSQTNRPLLFLLVDSTDHVTGKTGLTPTVTISKNGAAFASPAGTVSEIGSGWYKVAGNATDTGTLGPLLLHATGTAADPTDVQYEVVAFDPETTSMGLALAKTTNITGFNDLSAAQVNTEADTALADVGLTTTVTGRIDAAITTRLAPTVAARTLDVSATGEAGVDWANVGAPTTTVNLSGTTVATVSGNVTGSVGSVTGAVGSVTGDVGGNVTGSVGSVATGGIVSASFAAGAINAAAIATDAIGAAELAADAVTEIVNGVWNELQSGHTTAGTFGKFLDAQVSLGTAAAVWDLTTTGHTTSGTFGAAMSAAGAAGDPWSTSIPGAYGAGTAGNIVGNNLNATVGSRLATASYTAPDNAGITTLTGRLTAGRATNLDNLDAAISSRMATFTYTAPPSAASIATTVWQDLLAGADFGTAGSIGKLLKDNINAPLTGLAPASTALSTDNWTNAKAAFLDANISTRSSHTAADVWAVGTRNVTGGTITAITGMTIGNVEQASARIIDMTELAGSFYRMTAAALAQAPTGGGGTGGGPRTVRFVTQQVANQR